MRTKEKRSDAAKAPATRGSGPGPAPSSDLRQQLIEHATEMFSQRGYVDVSLRQLAELADVSVAAVYYHFSNKEDLLREIIFVGLDRLSKRVFSAVTDSASPEKTLEAVVRAHLGYQVEFPREARIIIEEGRLLSPVLHAAAREKQLAILNTYRACLSRLVAAGRVPPVDTGVMALNMISVVLGWYRWYRVDGALSKEQAFEFTVQFVLAGVLKFPAER